MFPSAFGYINGRMELWRHDFGISGVGCYGRSDFKRNWTLSTTSALRRADFASLSVEITLGLKIHTESANFNQDISPCLRREKLRCVPHDSACGSNDNFVYHIQNVLLVDSACAITSEIIEKKKRSNCAFSMSQLDAFTPSVALHPEA